MPTATTCRQENLEIDVVDALERRVQAKRAGHPPPDFCCNECGERINPHRGGQGEAHIEHRRRNPECPLSDAHRR